MDTNKYTKKALDAINNAQTLALERHNQQLCKEHIAYALLSDDEGLIPKLVNKCGADAPALLREIDKIISGFSSVTGSGAGEVYLAQDCALMLSQAEKLAKSQGDDFVSVEHIFQAILDNPSPALKTLLQSANSQKRTLSMRLNKLKRQK